MGRPVSLESWAPGYPKAIPDYLGGKEPSLWIIGGQKFDDAEPSPSHLASRARNCLCASFPRSQITLFHSFGSDSRYTERRLLCIPYCYLLGITVRSVPCNYNVIQSVSALSGAMFWVCRNSIRPTSVSLLLCHDRARRARSLARDADTAWQSSHPCGPRFS
jgi:hypothetical protein